MRNFMKCFLSALVFCIIVEAYSPFALGETPTDQGTLQKLIQKTRQDISNQKKREKSVLNNLTVQQQKLNQLEGNYRQIKTNLGTVQTTVTKTRKELSDLQNNLGSLEKNLKTQEQILNQRLVVTYTKGPQSYLEIIFQAKDFADLVSRFDSVAYFVKKDLKIIDTIQDTKVEVGQKKVAVQQKKEQVESEYQKMAAIRDQLAVQQTKIAVQVGNTKEELQKIQSDRAKMEKALEEYEQTSREIEAQIRNRENKNPGVILGSGSLIWPLRGVISSPFGWRYHPVLRKQKLHNGQDIAVASGTPVHAADSGVVVVSGWQGGYGNFIAIDHGNGISTCYGHNSRLIVHEGDKVVKGQVISYSGNTGLSTGPHLHFEVRKNGVPVDPMRYLTK